jgi:hypothetical protein
MEGVDNIIVADLYALLFDATRKDPQRIGHGREGYYFGENGELALSQIALRIHDALTKSGKITEQTVVNLTTEEAKGYYGGVSWKRCFITTECRHTIADHDNFRRGLDQTRVDERIELVAILVGRRNIRTKTCSRALR